MSICHETNLSTDIYKNNDGDGSMFINILIITETVGGAGHYAAARSLAETIRKLEPSAQIYIDEALPRVSLWLYHGSRFLYQQTIRHIPSLWGWAYQRESSFSKWLKSGFSRAAAIRMKHFLKEINPDVIVSTHAYCLGALAMIRSKNELPFRLGAAVTDFDINDFWVDKAVDFYIVATDDLKQKMIEQYGLNEQRIFSCGIPIGEKFSEFDEKTNKWQLRTGLGWDPHRFTILLSGGGTGHGPMIDLIESLSECEIPLQIVCVTGKNRTLYKKAANYLGRVPSRHHFHLYEYTDDMHLMMKSADLMIGKAGGLTLSEAMAVGLPVLVYKPIPGQEERNLSYLLKKNVLDDISDISELKERVAEYVHSGKKREEKREVLSRIGRPDSAREAARVILHHGKK